MPYLTKPALFHKMCLTQDFIRTTFARTYKEEGNEQQFHVLPHHFLAAAAAELIRFVGF